MPDEVAEHLRSLGAPAHDGDVVTSAQAGAANLADRVPAGARVLALGGPGVTWALEEAGRRPSRPRTTRRITLDTGTPTSWSPCCRASDAS